MALRSRPRSERQNRIPITAAESANRTAMYTATETSASASFTTTNVAPQISAQSRSPRSARSRLLDMKPRSLSGEDGEHKKACRHMMGPFLFRVGPQRLQGVIDTLRVAIYKSEYVADSLNPGRPSASVKMMKRTMLAGLAAGALLAFPIRGAKHENWV